MRVNVYKDQVKNAGASLPALPGIKELAAKIGHHHAVLRKLVVEQQQAAARQQQVQQRLGQGLGGPAGGGAPAGEDEWVDGGR